MISVDSRGWSDGDVTKKSGYTEEKLRYDPIKNKDIYLNRVTEGYKNLDKKNLLNFLNSSDMTFKGKKGKNPLSEKINAWKKSQLKKD